MHLRLGANAILLLFKSANFKNQREDSMDVEQFFFVFFFKEEMVSGEGFSVF